jgi:hypothetical protein
MGIWFNSELSPNYLNEVTTIACYVGGFVDQFLFKTAECLFIFLSKLFRIAPGNVSIANMVTGLLVI